MVYFIFNKRYIADDDNLKFFFDIVKHQFKESKEPAKSMYMLILKIWNLASVSPIIINTI